MAGPANANEIAAELATRPGHRSVGATLVRWLVIAISLTFLGALLAAPLFAVFATALEKGWQAYFQSFADPDTQAAIRLTLITAAVVVPLNTLFGITAAWCIAKFEFRGKSFLISLIDLPLAVSPIVSGLIYVLLFGLNGWFGAWLQEHDISIVYALPGIILATMFVTFPYVARELIPLMQQLGNDEEEAAITLGAGGWFTFFRVTLPRIRWGLVYGIILCNARAMGEFGAVSVVSGNIRGLTTTMPLHVEILYNEYNFVGAFAVASMLSILAVITLIIKTLVERSGVPAPMKRNSLGWWLAASNVTIVLLVAMGIAYFATDMLRGLADSQQKVRVQLAGANARQEINRMAEDTLTYARVLAERPPLRRLVGEPGRAGLAPFLRRFCDTSGLDACVVFDGAQVLAATGPELPWPELYAISAEQGERFMAVPQGTEFSVVGATSKLPAQYSSLSVMVVHLLDDSLARTLAEHSGFPVRLINFRAYSAMPVNEFTSLHSQAMTDGRFAVQRIDERELYAASFPVFSSTGEVIALILTTASATETDQAVSALVWRLVITAVVFAVLAVFAGVMLGWRVTRPAEALTDAAVRLGQGDFATSIPTAGPAEIGQLARTMDDMRRNLLELNSELRHREAEAQVVLEGVVEGVYAVDQERNITYLNPQAARLLGIEAGDAIGKFCGDVLKPCGPGGARPCTTTACPILRARQGGGAQSVEQLQTRSGNRQAVITSSRVVNGLQVQVLRDETELEGVRRARDTVLANVSHEFRTPLAAQLASIELLREGLKSAPPEKLEELVLSLERGTLRLTRLIDNLLESVRIESGQLDVRRQSIELGDVIEDARALVEALLRQRRQPLEVQVPEGVTLLGDATRLTQVFVNLIANASKFAPEDTPIRIGAETADKAGDQVVRAWVEDSGPGLPEGAVDIFDRFKRGAEEPEPGGLGLGLWISRSIVERHGGTIAVSRTADERTRFTITLPLAAE